MRKILDKTEPTKRPKKITKEQALHDYELALTSRHISLLGRKQVLNGKAKFGIFGDGKEVAQLALARAMRPGDFLVGYYRDQTVTFAHQSQSFEEFYRQLYADVDYTGDLCSIGRQMNGFSATRTVNADGTWRDLTKLYNSSSDTSPTSSQMPRALGLALASKLYRDQKELHELSQFSHQGNEVVCATIGDASTSEGHFWETINAAGVLKVPLVVSVWDDGYGISVPRHVQTTKGSISELLEGFRLNKKNEGINLTVVRGWDYPALIKAYLEAIEQARTSHIPAVLHITEVTQPQGHSTSGSHERYKSKERLAWEKEFCCVARLKAFILEERLATKAELATIEVRAEETARTAQDSAWSTFRAPIMAELEAADAALGKLAEASAKREEIATIRAELRGALTPIRRDVMHAVRRALRVTSGEASPARAELVAWREAYAKENRRRFNTHLYSETSESALLVPEVPAVYSKDSPTVNGNQVIQAVMDSILGRDPRVCIFGEDVGIGDVNHGLVGLRDKHGGHRIFDTGIREATIIGQGMGMAMRGLRPIAEIQYLDYLLFGLEPLSDDLATLRYRTMGGQKAPLIVRTRGHRLEGIWHTGSPMGMVLHGLRGMYILTPRNMTQAAGLYNTMVRSDDPALLIECLNGYGVKERLPDNIGDFTVPLGVPEVLRPGTDLTMVTYGSCCRICMEACTELATFGIEVELVDVQTLSPFDRFHKLRSSLERTNRLMVVDEDVPGGASAFILQQILDVQNGYELLDSPPRTLTAQEHRGAYSSDGDYFSKPSADDIVEAVYGMMREVNPGRWP